MSTVTADAAPAAQGKKKLILIVAIALAVVLAGGVGALLLMKKNSADAELDADAADHDEGPARKVVAKRDPKAKAPVFVPLEPFTVNLADRDADRYAQVAVTLEVDDPAIEMQLKNYMPAIRNNILLALADRTAGELLGRDGKQALADRIRRETARGLGYELPTEAELTEAADAAEADTGSSNRRRARRPVVPELPIRAVHFANFIIQ